MSEIISQSSCRIHFLDWDDSFDEVISFDDGRLACLSSLSCGAAIRF